MPQSSFLQRGRRIENQARADTWVRPYEIGFRETIRFEIETWTVFITVLALSDYLFLTLLDCLGVPIEKLGDSTGKVEHLADILQLL